ncbi:hypothetical protein DL93DRAFT_1511400 [Clavulina sp. PMI_390]|nr:hypothetical protein DL93DRAFT_1511400 [Clavulina sp. PMI_390]
MSSSQGRGESTRRDDISSQQRAGPPPQPRSRNPPPGSELNRVSTASSSISQNSSSSSSSSSRQSHMSSSQDGAKNEDSVSSSYSTPGPSAVPPSSSQSTDDGSTTVLLSPTKHVSSSRGYKTTRLLPPTPSLIIPNPNSSSTPPSSVLASSTSSNPTPSTVTQLSPRPPTSVPAIISSKASPATSLQFASYEDGDYERDDYGGDDDGASSGTNSTPTPPASPIYRTGKMQAWSPAPPLSMGMAFTSPTTPSAHSAGSNNANLSGAPNSFLRAQQQQQQRPHTASSASSSMAWTRPGTGTGAGSGVPPLPPIDVVLEDVWIYVSPAAVVARDTRRKERELYDVSPSSPSVVLAGGHGGSSAVGNGSSGGGTGGDRPALRERPSFMNLNKILPGATSSSSSSASPSPAPGGAGATGFSGPSGGGVSGPWRRATLRLTEQIYDQRASSYLLQIQERSVLSGNVQRDHTTHIYLQHHVTTDVRLVHRSLFHLQHVLGIFNST